MPILSVTLCCQILLSFIDQLFKNSCVWTRNENTEMLLVLCNSETWAHCRCQLKTLIYSRPFPASSESVNWELCLLAQAVVWAFLPAARPTEGAVVQSHPRYLFTSKIWRTGEGGVVLCEHEICSRVCRLTVTWHPEHCAIRCHISKDSNNGNSKNTFFPLQMYIFSNGDNIIVQPF